MKTRILRSGIIALLALATTATASRAASITIAPGSSPAGGYLPLSLFGIAPIAGVGDDTITNLVTPAYLYAGESWNDIGVVSNGYVVVGGGTSSDVNFFPQTFPNSARPNNVLAPFWTDLNPGPTGSGNVRIGTLTDGADSWLVVDWDAVKNFSNSGVNSFEVWIGLAGDAHPVEDITFVYGSVTTGDPGSALNIGAEDKTGTVGANWAGGVTNGTQLRVSTEGLPLTPVPEPASLTLLGLGLAGIWRARRK